MKIVERASWTTDFITETRVIDKWCGAYVRDQIHVETQRNTTKAGLSIREPTGSKTEQNYRGMMKDAIRNQLYHIIIENIA